MATRGRARDRPGFASLYTNKRAVDGSQHDLGGACQRRLQLMARDEGKVALVQIASIQSLVKSTSIRMLALSRSAPLPFPGAISRECVCRVAVRCDMFPPDFCRRPPAARLSMFTETKPKRSRERLRVAVSL